MVKINSSQTVGWIGAGRMGYAMAKRLLDAGCDVAVYNRTRAKAEPLQEFGATIVDSPASLGSRDIIFTMVSGPADLKEVVAGENGVLSRGETPSMFVDCSSVSEQGSNEVRSILAERGAIWIGVCTPVATATSSNVSRKKRISVAICWWT